MNSYKMEMTVEQFVFCLVLAAMVSGLMWIPLGMMLKKLLLLKRAYGKWMWPGRLRRRLRGDDYPDERAALEDRLQATRLTLNDVGANRRGLQRKGARNRARRILGELRAAFPTNSLKHAQFVEKVSSFRREVEKSGKPITYYGINEDGLALLDPARNTKLAIVDESVAA